MSEQLAYKIANHSLIIQTPNAKITSKLIPSFKPFQVDIVSKEIDLDTINSTQENDLLFIFSGNKKIEIPNKAPDDTMEVDKVLFNIYHIEGSTTIQMKLNNKEHALKICINKKSVTSNLSLIEPYENLFLAYFLRAAFGVISAHYKTIKIHASVIEQQGKALVFLGKSGVGKSTHSRLWQKFVPGCQLLNDDEPIIRVMKDDSIRVYGAPWSGSTICYHNIWAQVAAFVYLNQSPQNKLTQIKGVHAFAYLLESVAFMRSSIENRKLINSTINIILEKIPVYRLKNKPNAQAVALTQTLINP